MMFPRTIKKFSHFMFQSVLPNGVQPSEQFTHQVMIARKAPRSPEAANLAKYQADWYLKEVESLEAAEREVLAQEFLRLIIPNQPKTRVVVGDNGKFYVASKGIPNFKKFGEIRYSLNNKDLKLPGLGMVLLVSLLLNESDLNLNNIGIDDQGEVVKIDGGWCFLHLIEKDLSDERFALTEKQISTLPYVDGYRGNQWLDQGEFAILFRRFNNDESFRREINDTILKILLIPNHYIEAFIGCYISPQNLPIFLNELISRISQLAISACQNKSFNNFFRQKIKDGSLEQDTICLIKQLKDFRTSAKDNIEAKNLEADINQIRNGLAGLVEQTTPVFHYPVSPRLKEYMRCEVLVYLNSRAASTSDPFNPWSVKTIPFFDRDLTTQKIQIASELNNSLLMQSDYENIKKAIKTAMTNNKAKERERNKTYFLKSSGDLEKCLLRINKLLEDDQAAQHKAGQTQEPLSSNLTKEDAKKPKPSSWFCG